MRVKYCAIVFIIAFLLVGGCTHAPTPEVVVPDPIIDQQLTVEERAHDLVTLAKRDLGDRQDVEAEKIFVQSVEATEFKDASLGVPEPGKRYAQVVVPGYVIRLIVGGKVYRYHAAGESVVLVRDEEREREESVAPTVTLFYGNKFQSADCGAVFALTRNVSRIEIGPQTALTQLFAGATQEEREQGYVSSFSSSTQDILRSVTIKGDTAYVDLVDIRSLMPSVSTSCGQQAFFAEVEATLGHVSSIERVIYAIEGDPALFYDWVQLGCSDANDWCDETPFEEVDTALQPRSDETGSSHAGDPWLVLPESTEPISHISADLNGDDLDEEILLVGFGGTPQRMGYDFLQLMIVAVTLQDEYVIAWKSGQLPTERGETVQVQDLDGDGLPEALSVQAMGAAGQTMYVVSWRGQRYDLCTPHGGRFDGQDSFGESGVRLEDVDGDGSIEILGSYGPAAARTDVYAWDGQRFAYVETRTERAVEIDGLEAALAEAMLYDRSALCEWEVWGQTDETLYLWAVCASETGASVSTPAAVYQSANGEIMAVSIPGDGAQYGQDVRRIFPPEVQERIFAHAFDANGALERIAARREAQDDG